MHALSLASCDRSIRHFTPCSLQFGVAQRALITVNARLHLSRCDRAIRHFSLACSSLCSSLQLGCHSGSKFLVYGVAICQSAGQVEIPFGWSSPI